MSGDSALCESHFLNFTRHHTQIDQGSDRRESRKLGNALAPGLVLTWRTVSSSANLIMDPPSSRYPLGRGALLLESLGPGSGGSYVGRADRRQRTSPMLDLAPRGMA